MISLPTTKRVKNDSINMEMQETTTIKLCYKLDRIRIQDLE